MSDENWRFGIDDVGPDTSGVDVASGEESDETESSGGSVHDMPNIPLKGQALVLIPAWAVAIYTFLSYQSTVTALTALFGGVAPLAKVAASALAVVGGATVGGFGLIVLLAIAALAVGLVKRDVVRLIVSVLTFALIGVLWYLSGVFFSHLPALVVMGVGIPILGMYLSLIGVIVSASIVIGGIVMLATVFLL